MPTEQVYYINEPTFLSFNFCLREITLFMWKNFGLANLEKTPTEDFLFSKTKIEQVSGNRKRLNQGCRIFVNQISNEFFRVLQCYNKVTT